MLPSIATAQTAKPDKQESRMTDRLPKAGTSLPGIEIYNSDGQPISTEEFKDQYTVLVFGCLT